ncbi:MAG: PHP domain-containing protein [Cyanobacteria bacterium M_surface_10_m2_179]|nr:PHP domain-containing protein [Cyanobacteria bacterium M_surface_10_m2_179]
MERHPLRAVLEQVDASSCPGRFNFHCHTIHSDGSLRPEQLGAQALSIGLEHLAVTDHHSTAATAPLQCWFAEQEQVGHSVPVLWSGVEISCLLEGCLVHVLALGFQPGHPALHPYGQGAAPVGELLRASAVVERIHAAGGLALLAHPGRYRLNFQRLIPAAAALGFDGAEAYYDYAMQPRWQPTPVVCDAIARLLDNHALLRSCGTDTHGLELCGR